ncbi:hypothetical protein FRB99_006126 [Tulasnella sp. 403]|nr:hypothetical protein FRB99_006126 [Tulasnella sp. 403]
MSLTIQNAALQKQTNLVRSLLSNDPALLNSVDGDGRTALHWAASSGALDIVRDLLSHDGIEVDKRDNASWTPLMIAVSAGDADIVRELLGAGANDRMGNTPLHLAMESANAEVAVLLIEAGAARDRLNFDGDAPEDMTGVGGLEQRRAKEYLISRCGRP